MALFEKVTFDFYVNDLGRSVVPSETEFNRYALENKLYVKRLIGDGLIAEREENGIDSALCLMIEIDYQAAKIAAGASLPTASENIGSYSRSKDTKAYDMQLELNAKSIEGQKYRVLGLYCDITAGVI